VCAIKELQNHSKVLFQLAVVGSAKDFQSRAYAGPKSFLCNTARFAFGLSGKSSGSNLARDERGALSMSTIRVRLLLAANVKAVAPPFVSYSSTWRLATRVRSSTTCSCPLLLRVVSHILKRGLARWLYRINFRILNHPNNSCMLQIILACS
jgi:hypothetical protein